jgi:uncharacterized protein (TIGR03067 family)
MSALHGHWLPVRAELDGQEAPALALERMEFTLSPEGYEVRFAGEVHDRGTFTHTETSLSMTARQGRHDGRVIAAIYQLAGDRLRVCYGLDGTAPDAFKTAVNSGRYLVTYRRRSPDARA